MLLVIGGNFALGLTIKTAQNTKIASVNSPWTCIWDGLLSEGYLHLRFGGGGGAYFQEGLFLPKLMIGILRLFSIGNLIST